MSDEKLFDDRIASGIRFRDETILRFDEMDPPKPGDVLSFDPTPRWMPAEDLPKSSVTSIPSAPTGLVVTTTTDETNEGGIATANVHVSWTAPTTNDDGSPITDLLGYQVTFGDYRLSGLIPVGTEYFKLNNLPTDTLYMISVIAVDVDGNNSPVLTGSVTTATPVIVPDATNVVASSSAPMIASVTCDAVIRPDMQGILVGFRQHTTDGEPPPPESDASGWGAWTEDRLVAYGSGKAPTFTMSAPTVGKYVQFRVKLIVYGGTTSTNYVLSNAILVNSISSDDFSLDLNAEIAELVGSGSVFLDGSGLVCKNGKLLFYSDDGTGVNSFLRVGLQGVGLEPQVVASNATGQKALLGKSGTFWGLYVEGGAIMVKTAGDALIMDASGITLTDASGNVSTIKQDGISFEGATITGGVFRTGSSGARVEISDWGTDTSFIRMYSDHTNEGNPASIQTDNTLDDPIMRIIGPLVTGGNQDTTVAISQHTVEIIANDNTYGHGKLLASAYGSGAIQSGIYVMNSDGTDQAYIVAWVDTTDQAYIDIYGTVTITGSFATMPVLGNATVGGTLGVTGDLTALSSYISMANDTGGYGHCYVRASNGTYYMTRLSRDASKLYLGFYDAAAGAWRTAQFV